jgi:uncharacterized membrane protein
LPPPGSGRKTTGAGGVHGVKLLLTAYFTTLAAFFGIDFPWLSTMGERLYRPILKDVLADRFRPAPAIGF